MPVVGHLTCNEGQHQGLQQRWRHKLHEEPGDPRPLLALLCMLQLLLDLLNFFLQIS